MLYRWPAMSEIMYVHRWMKGDGGFGQDIRAYPGLITEQIVRGVFAFDNGINEYLREERKRRRQQQEAAERASKRPR